MQPQFISAQNIDAVARLILLIGVLLFPILLPYILFSFFAKDDDEGISNEELWRKERRERSIVTRDELQVLCWWYYSWTTRYTNSEGLSSSTINEALCLEVEEHLSSRPNRLRTTVIIIPESVFGVALSRDPVELRSGPAGRHEIAWNVAYWRRSQLTRVM